MWERRVRGGYDVWERRVKEHMMCGRRHDVTSLLSIGVDAGALCARQIIDAPPTHLEEDEGDEKGPKSEFRMMRRHTSVVHIYEISQPRDGRPGLLWIP